MKKVSWKIYAGVVASLLIVIWWNYSFPSGELRYRMTVTVLTPEGTKTGSAVRQVSINTQPGLYSTSISRATVQGEAVVIDLGKRGVLFALLTGSSGCEQHAARTDYGAHVIFDTFPSPDALTPDGVRYYLHLKNAKAFLTPANYPLFAHYKDRDDPKSIEVAKNGNLESILGDAVKIVQIQIETTDDPLTHQVDRYIPSYDEAKTSFMAWFQKLSIQDCRGVLPSAFKTGVY